MRTASSERSRFQTTVLWQPNLFLPATIDKPASRDSRAANSQSFSTEKSSRRSAPSPLVGKRVASALARAPLHRLGRLTGSIGAEPSARFERIQPPLQRLVLLARFRRHVAHRLEFLAL